MDPNRWQPVISIASVVIFFLWGWLDTFQHSWLIFVVGGLAMAVLRAKSGNSGGKKNGNDSGDSGSDVNVDIE